MTHWATGYVGTPWDAAENHCWGFVRRVWRDQFGWDVPAVTVDAASPVAVRRALAEGQGGWVEVQDPYEGDGIMMAMGQRACHVGVWVTPTPDHGVLHAVSGPGVIFTPPGRLAGMGYRISGIYRRRA